ncbi:hypothetical protein K474DRAFT_1671071 [Panus rudis PR-1116 ss-1]|nr:hypothetical protein K474DRAFT_1671071 [Panus rudis PR-1116 ss-1]
MTGPVQGKDSRDRSKVSETDALCCRAYAAAGGAPPSQMQLTDGGFSLNRLPVLVQISMVYIEQMWHGSQHNLRSVMSSNNNIYAISSPMPDRRSARNRQPLSRTDSHDTPNSLHHIPAAMPTSRIGNTKKRKSVHKTKPYIATDLSRLGPQLVAKRLRHRRQRDQSKAYDPSPLSNSGQSTSIPTTPGKDQLSSPSSSRTPHSSSSEAREILRLARETVQDYDLTEQGSKPSLMDVILDARPPVTRYSEDLLFDAIEFGKPQPIDGFKTQRDLYDYWAHQEFLWRGLKVEPMDVSPRKIYHVSAERSTATWDTGIGPNDADGFERTEQIDCGSLHSRSSPDLCLSSSSDEECWQCLGSRYGPQIEDDRGLQLLARVSR